MRKLIMPTSALGIPEDSLIGEPIIRGERSTGLRHRLVPGVAARAMTEATSILLERPRTAPPTHPVRWSPTRILPTHKGLGDKMRLQWQDLTKWVYISLDEAVYCFNVGFREEPMSQLLIQRYLNELDVLRRVSGTQRESVVREAFKTLLKEWGRGKGLLFIPEYEHTTIMHERRYVDGALVEPQLRLPVGYWEAKDTSDDLDAEIAKKFRRGYPQDNIIFEDSHTAVLIQNKREVFRCPVEDPERIKQLVDLFFEYEPEVIHKFHDAVDQFKKDLPTVLETLRKAIDNAEIKNTSFRKSATKFLEHARETINPSVSAADVREMLIQHVLTEQIFSQVFDNSDFHHNNNVAKELYELEATFFTGGVRCETIDRLKPYYSAIKRAATQVSSHQEKQKFLKVIYENFYKVYNRKAADRLGVAYTPNEVVRFMIESADWLCQKHFSKRLIDRNVEILDPATGTGTFIVDLLEHFRGQSEKLRHKYLEELHANEVAILPYYVANLNIEATYAALTGRYEEYPNLCFVDTLDNVAALKKHVGEQISLFGAVSEENIARIRRQNKRRISVIIGNPPYNANQLNENQNNKNREYDAIDKRIKDTYIAASRAQKTKQYDMFVRFVRWATDRLPDRGIVAFITNRSFIDKLNFDGFRKTLAKDFSDIWVVDLGGDWKEQGIAAGGNVFGIGTGVAISLLVKDPATPTSSIRYAFSSQSSRDDKLAWLDTTSISSLEFERIAPNEKGYWLDTETNGFEALLPLVSKVVKQTKRKSEERAIFKTFSLGVVTARDEWVYAYGQDEIVTNLRYFLKIYNAEVRKYGGKKLKPEMVDKLDDTIKWTRAVKADLERGEEYRINTHNFREALYRPFCKRVLYFDPKLNEMRYQLQSIYPMRRPNLTILFTGAGSQKPFVTLATSNVYDYHLVGGAAATVGAPMWQSNSTEGGFDNITDWALERFHDHYEKGERVRRAIDKDAIFRYVYAVLHDPVYRVKYALNLKREFPRIPFYRDFWKWADWGKELMALHVGYEKVVPWPLKRVDTVDKTAKKSGIPPKAMLKALKEADAIQLDSDTQLTGVPKGAWNYRLGNRSALEWILDQYKEKTPKDPTIREKFNTYRFADFKDHVIDLLSRA